MQPQTLQRLLTVAGTAPFIFAASALAGGAAQLPIVALDSQLWLSSYTLLIVSFMAGTLWSSQSHCRRVALLSNVIALCSWASYLWLPAADQYRLAVVLFGWLLWFDWQRHNRGNQVDWRPGRESLAAWLKTIVERPSFKDGLAANPG